MIEGGAHQFRREWHKPHPYHAASSSHTCMNKSESTYAFALNSVLGGLGMRPGLHGHALGCTAELGT